MCLVLLHLLASVLVLGSLSIEEDLLCLFEVIKQFKVTTLRSNLAINLVYFVDVQIDMFCYHFVEAVSKNEATTHSVSVVNIWS